MDLSVNLALLPADGVVTSAQSLLNHVEVQKREKVGPTGSLIYYRSVQFLDGRRASLIDLGPASAFVVESKDGNREFFSVDSDGNIGKKLSAGESITASAEYQRDVTLTVGPDGSTLTASPMNVSNGIAMMQHTSVEANLNASGELSMTSSLLTYTNWTIAGGGTGGTTSVQGTETASVWSETTLVDATGPSGVEVTSTTDLFQFYKNTEEGQALINRESGHYTTPSYGAESRLFVARVKYNRDEGGVELFSEFMPERTALLNSPDELAAYDEQLAKVLNHVQANSKITEDDKSLDSGMQFIIASGVTEAIGSKPELVGMLLSDLDRGWRIELEASYGGLYTMRQPLFQSVKSKIHFRLDTLLYSYARPNDVTDVVAHELAHSFDGKGTDETNGVPGGMPSADVSILLSERIRLTEFFRSTNDPSGLDPYAFENKKEFWAEISQYYLSGTTGAALVKAASPLLHGILVNYYD